MGPELSSLSLPDLRRMLAQAMDRRMTPEAPAVHARTGQQVLDLCEELTLRGRAPLTGRPLR